LSAYIASIGKRTLRDAAQDAAELCKLATSLNRLNEIACNSGLTERQERRKQNLQARIKAVLEGTGLVLNPCSETRPLLRLQMLRLQSLTPVIRGCSFHGNTPSLDL